MNDFAVHRIALDHHQDLLREAEQRRAAHLAQPGSTPPPRLRIVVHLPATQTPCPTC